MLAAGVATWRVWCESSEIRPGWMAGHSLGEYTALVCGNAISFADGIRLVAERGRLMQAAVPAGVGAMAAILGLNDDIIIKACSDSANGEIVTAVNFNAPGQVVIAGEAAAVERAMAALKDLGAKRALKLPVSVTSHCVLMAGAAEELATTLQNINITAPDTRIIHNADVLTHRTADEIRNALKQQLFMPVRWVEDIQALHQQGVSRFIECGPGKVLMGLNKRIAAEAAHFTVFDPDSLSNVLEQING
jgi:[acyl-carrier-protein] S-malonyltransferase